MEEKDSVCVWQYEAGTWFAACGFELGDKGHIIEIGIGDICPSCERPINILRKPKKEGEK